MPPPPPYGYGSVKESSSGISDGSSPSDVSSGSSSSSDPNPFNTLIINYVKFIPNALNTATEFQNAGNSRVGLGYSDLTPYMTWTDEGGGMAESVTIDLAKAWDDGVITTQADILLHADWDPDWDGDSGTPPNPDPGSGPIAVYLYYQGIIYEWNGSGLGTLKPSDTAIIPVTITDNGTVLLD